MHTLNQASKPLTLFGAILAIIGVIALAVTLAATSTQAQNADNTYADPQPCGPAANAAFQPEPHEITEGHFALFDTYWVQLDVGDSPDRDGELHTNECPPLVVTTTETREDEDTGEEIEVTVSSLEISHIDVDEAIFHVEDEHKADVVATAAEATEGQLSLEEYRGVRAALGLGEADTVSAETQVWWLQLDDPDTDADETSALTLGFSTKRFDSLYWGDAPDGDAPFRYKFELERHDGIPAREHPHFLAYRAPRPDDTPSEPVWNSAAPDTGDMTMEHGQLEDLQWVFTKPGTYEISVHLQGYVRQAEPENAPDGWQPISGPDTLTETSEIKRYVIQVGNKLEEVEPPRFGININVDEPPAHGSNVGLVIPVHGEDLGNLQYSLVGDGSQKFALEPRTEPNGVQIVAVDGNRFNPFDKTHYQLSLNVTNNVDHEGNPDGVVDDSLPVDIRLTYPWLTLTADTHHVHTGYVATLNAHIANVPDTNDVTFHFVDQSGNVLYSGLPSYSISRSYPTTEVISVYATWLPDGGDPATDTQRVDSHNSVTINWTPRP